MSSQIFLSEDIPPNTCALIDTPELFGQEGFVEVFNLSDA
jgi:hypothetical protein